MTLKYKDYVLVGTPSEVKEFIKLIEQKPATSNFSHLPDDIDDTISRLNSMDRYNLPENDGYCETLMPKDYFMKDDKTKETFNYINKFLKEFEEKHNLKIKVPSNSDRE